MAVNAPISFQFAGLPLDYCFVSPERFALDIVAGLSGFLPGSFNKIINSDTEPSISDRIDSLWHKTSDSRIYHYDGAWISKNPEDASGDARRIFVGAASDVWSYDGGSGDDPSTNPPTANTGAMWEVDHTFDFRFPLGAGTSPTSVVASVGGTGGEENHVLTIAEMPAHRHDIVVGAGTGGASINGSTNGTPNITDQTSIQSTGGGAAHNNIPPYVGVYFIKRTARINYVA